MCRLLILAFDSRRTLPDGSPDPSQDLTMTYDKWDLLHAIEDGQEWGSEELRAIQEGRAKAIEVPGRGPREFDTFKQADADPIAGITFRQRKYKLDLESTKLSESERAGIRNGVRVVLTKAQILDIATAKTQGAGQ